MDAPGDLRRFFRHFTCICFAAFGCLPASASNPALTNQSIPWTQLGANATAQYSGDGLGVIATPLGAQLRCVLQKLDGEVTAEGLSLSSTVPDARDRLQVIAARIDRDGGQNLVLDKRGTVQVIDAHARYVRPALIEEYSVTADGIQQDFLVTESPAGRGPLRLHLTLRGACAETSPDGARLVFEASGRKLNYNRLRVTDATGRQLAAWMEVAGKSEIENLKSKMELEVAAKSKIKNQKSKMELAVVVEDTGAIYPLRIDPTFSDANWISMGGIPGANDTVRAVLVDGAGDLYIGGYFTIVGNVFATNIAKWNGSSWSPLGSGMARTDGFSPTVRALAVLGDDVYAGGSFQSAGGNNVNYIAKWNGSSWSPLGSGMARDVLALVVSGSDLYAGGWFTNAGGSAANYVAKWDGTSWSALGSGMSGAVSALLAWGSELYAGGSFTNAGGTPAKHIAKWNGSSWSALGSGMTRADGYLPSVNALAISGSDLYAGGYFQTAGGTAANRIAKWDGSTWSALGSGLVWTGGFVAGVHALVVWDSDLYVGGHFTTAGGIPAKNIAKWNGSSWSALGSGMVRTDGYAANVNALVVSGSDLYVGGGFTTAGSGAGSHIAKWNGTDWSALGSGMNHRVLALAVSGGDVYAGGVFTTAGWSNANYVAKWNGTSWGALGSGMNSWVHALAISGDDLYAGGSFTNAGGIPANRIAKWNGTSWSALTLGVGAPYPSTMRALAVSGSDLYAGGEFMTAGGSPATNIAKWNGSSWSPLGSGMNRGVSALAASGGVLYAGGSFTMAGGSPANRIAKWNGSNWSALSSGMNDTVFALAVSGDDLYAGGSFTSPANRIAKWNGSSWSALGSGMGGLAPTTVYALAVSGSDLYAGGTFTTAGGSPANYIAKWNGSSWSALASGMNSNVSVLVVSGSDLYAGGLFTRAGDKVSAYIAKARIASAAESITASGSSATIQFSGVVGYEYHVQRTLSLTPPMTWITLTTTPLSPAADGSLIFTDTRAPPGTAYYRLVKN